MLTMQEESYMREIYADVVDDMPDDEMLDLMEEMECMDLEDQFDYLMKVAKAENPREEQPNPCCVGRGCNYCLMTNW